MVPDNAPGNVLEQNTWKVYSVSGALLLSGWEVSGPVRGIMDWEVSGSISIMVHLSKTPLGCVGRSQEMSRAR